jgi:hypothetical protein
MQNQLSELMGLYQQTQKAFGVDYVKQQAIYLTCPLQTYGNERNRQI